MSYVVFDPVSGRLTGGMVGQEIAHENALNVPDDVARNWPLYRMADARKSVELIGQQALDIEVARGIKLAEISAAWAAADSGVFVFRGKPISAQPDDQMKILNAAMSAIGLDSFWPDWPGGWRTADNDFLPLPRPADLLDMQRAMVAQGTGNFNRARALKERAGAAQTVAELDSIKWGE